MADWFKAHLEELMPAIEDKRRALAAYKTCPTEYNLQGLRAARSKVQQAARRRSNDYWLQLCSQIQTAVDIKGIYDGIKQALGPVQNKSASLKSATGIITQNQVQQMERWVQHYSELYSRAGVSNLSPSLGHIRR